MSAQAKLGSGAWAEAVALTSEKESPHGTLKELDGRECLVATLSRWILALMVWCMGLPKTEQCDVEIR